MFYLIFLILGLLILGYILMDLYLKISLKIKLLDEPKEFNMHMSTTPTGSGIIFVILYVIFIAGIRILEINSLIELTYPNRFYLLNTFIVAISLMSFWDDFKSIHPNIRFFFQIIFVSFSLPLINVEILNNYLPLKLILFITIFYWVYQINCINFIDGLDGFLATYSIFFFFNSFIYFFKFDPSNFFFTFCIFIFLINIIFIFFNKPPAKIFMGDSGSIFLGYAIGLVSLYFASISRIDISISLICYPIIDCSLTIINKVLKGRYPWERLFDYNFLKPVKKFNQTHSYVLRYFIFYKILITKNLFLQIFFNFYYFFILSIIYTLVLILFYNKNLKNKNA